ncbi:MAG TPA: DinB family protein [Gemmatimonadales bacterium]|nr:DinB family protein [Gemmatimonadales bacterium]
MRKLIAALAVVAFAATPVVAQDHAEHGEMKHTDPVTAVQPIQGAFLGWVTQAAEELTAAEYNYRPVETVRTIGQLFGHVANANYMICAVIAGESSPSSTDFEKASRTDIINGLKGATAYCSKVAESSAKRHHDPISLFGMNGDVTWATAFNASHNAEHYGNIVTYMRMMGKVPPSSR